MSEQNDRCRPVWRGCHEGSACRHLQREVGALQREVPDVVLVRHVEAKLEEARDERQPIESSDAPRCWIGGVAILRRRHVHLPGEDARLGVTRGEDLEEETLPSARKRRPIALLDHERRRRRRHRTDEFVGVLAGHGQGSQAVGVPAECKLPQAIDECGDGVRGRSRLRNCRFAGTKHERERQQEPKGHGCTILDPSFDKETRPI